MATLTQLESKPPVSRDIRLSDHVWSILSAIAVIAFFFLGIEHPEEEPVNTSGPRIAEIVTFESSEKQLGTPPWQRNLEAWIILRDPTLMSLPNDRYGFSNVLRLGFDRPLETLPYVEPDFLPLPPNEIPDRPVYMPVASPYDSLIGARLREPLGLPDVQALPPKAPGVYWTHADGRAAERVPPMDLTSLLGEGPYTVNRPTHITTLPRGTSIRVRVDLTSGNAVLDQAAVDQLRKIFTTFADIEPPTETMRWWLSQPRSFIIHWRYAPNVTSKADPINKEDWRDNGWF